MLKVINIVIMYIVCNMLKVNHSQSIGTNTSHSHQQQKNYTIIASGVTAALQLGAANMQLSCEKKRPVLFTGLIKRYKKEHLGLQHDFSHQQNHWLPFIFSQKLNAAECVV